MEWRIAQSLSTLRRQVNEAYPNRDKSSDGVIGDAAHAKTKSDHNPNDQDVVCALDLDHDPDNGFDGDAFLAAQLNNPHPQLKFIVFKGYIYSRIRNFQPKVNSGHYTHVHISVGVGPEGKSAPGTYDSTIPWDIGNKKGTVMSADALTHDEFRYLHILAFGGEPGASYDGRFTGRPLTETLHAWLGTDPLKNKNVLATKVKDSQLVAPGGSLDKEKLYNEITTAVNKAFGK